MPNDMLLPDDIEKLICEREKLRERDREIEGELQAWADSIRRRLAAVGVSFTAEPGKAIRPVVSLPQEVIDGGPPASASQADMVTEIVRRMDKVVRIVDVEAVLNEWGVKIPKSAVRSYLAHGVNEGVLERVARGQYVAVPAEDSSTPDVLHGESYSRLLDMTLTDAAFEIVRAAGGPIHMAALYDKLISAGVQAGGSNPKNTLYGIVQKDGRLVNLGKNTWDLAERQASGEKLFRQTPGDV